MDANVLRAIPVVYSFIAPLLGLLPAAIAYEKGVKEKKSLFLWWVYGTLLFIVALIHSIVLYANDSEYAAQFDTPPMTGPINGPMSGNNFSTASAADELKKYKELYDEGIISYDEFETKKKQLLNL